MQLPLKWCAVDGSPAVVNPSAAPPNPYTGDPEPDTDAVLWRRHERASDNIWIPGADITFRSGFTADVRDNADFPIISDPCPPATATLCQGGDNQGMSCTPDGAGEDAAVCGAGVTCATQSCPGACTLDGTGLDACLGNVGDLTGVGTYCQGGTANGQGCSPDNSGEDAGICGAGVTCARDLLEYNLATAACDAAWDDLQDTWDTPLPGQIAVNIHRFRNPDGNLDGLKGRATGSAFNAGASLCDMPPTGVTSASGGAVIGIDNQNFASSESGSNIAFEENNERMIAHELGHNVFLWHGDGLDNDGNGVFDQACDSAENTCLAPTTFMSSSSCGSYSTAMTSDQGDHAGIVAAQYDGQVTDPPNQLIAGPVISDGRTDPPLDVEDGQIDLTRVMVLDDRGQERTEVLHFTREPVTADTGVAREYLTLIDLDGLPETGGEPASIGFPSELAGADLALKVRYTRPPGSEFPSPVPTIWFARDGEWAECSTDFSRFCGLVRAEIRPMLGGDDDLDRRDLHRPTVSGTAVAITFPSRLRSDFTQASRLQAIAQVIKLGPPDEVVEIDRLPQQADRARAIRVREARYPICGVEPTSARPGEFVTLLAEDMQSNVTVKAFVGDRRVGEGQTDANGAVSISIQVPFETPRGMRLVTIGVMNQALSADCPLEVRGEPVARPAYEYAAKMICGVQKDPRGQVLARGFYTTVLNLRNTRTRHGEN